MQGLISKGTTSSQWVTDLLQLASYSRWGGSETAAVHQDSDRNDLFSHFYGCFDSDKRDSCCHPIQNAKMNQATQMIYFLCECAVFPLLNIGVVVRKKLLYSLRLFQPIHRLEADHLTCRLNYSWIWWHFTLQSLYLFFWSIIREFPSVSI